MIANLLRLLGRLFGGSTPSTKPTDLPEEFDSVAGAVDKSISHGFVLPDRDFLSWYRAAEPYTEAFARVAVVRSPAGNDLNRFRNITAVEAPNVWLHDNALAHIRRIYPSVVRVDTIKANTPSQLQQILQQRIAANDRYGENQNAGQHIDERFVLNWPADALPASITTPFNAQQGDNRNEGVDIYAPPGTTIRAAISGIVALVVRTPTALGYGQYVQIDTQHQGTEFLVTHAHLSQINVTAGQEVEAGDPIGVSDWDSIKLVVQTPGQGLAGYQLPDVVDPTPMIYWNSLRLQPTDNGLRLRERPGTQFPIIGQINLGDELETLEPHGRTLAKVGRNGQWLNVRMPNGTTGHAAAWFLNAISPDLVGRVRLTGINLDFYHRLGKPAPNRLGNMGWVRFAYNVSYNPQDNTHGNIDLTQAYARYRPFIEQYARAGYQVMVVFTHQTYGEGQHYNWNEMDSTLWRDLTGRFVDMVRQIAGQYAGQNLIHAYQIWNEQDAQPGLGASVPMPPGNYAFLLGETIRAIRKVDSKVPIITGGHTTGPASGTAYARATLKAMPPGIAPDGIAIHPYGRGTTPGLSYTPFGHIDDEIQAYSSVLPGKPLWMTEWGVLDHPDEPVEDIATYAADMVQNARQKHPGKLAAMIWFAWAQSMHNGYGLVGTDDQPRQPLYDTFMKL